MPETVAALFVESEGPYFGVEGVDPWDVGRDARAYRGPHKVIAHPPCKRWGRYWSGGPSATTPRIMGDDGGCFASALWSVRTFGGVIEHPEASHAWAWFGLPKPGRYGGWTVPDQFGGRACCVAQSAYGHRARKLTWLYAVGCGAPQIDWSHPKGERMDDGFHSTEARHIARSMGVKPKARLTADERLHTPIPFRELLLRIVRGEDSGAPVQRDLFEVASA